MYTAQSIHQDALLSQWSDINARRAGVAFHSLEAFRAVAGLRMPEAVRAVVLSDPANGGDDRLVAAFNRAADVCALLAMVEKSSPGVLSPEAVDPMSHTEIANGARRLKPIAAVRSAIQNALAERDEPIDTTRAYEDQPITDEATDGVYAKRASAATKGGTR